MANKDKVSKKGGEKISRREFLGAAGAAAAFTMVPRHVLGGAGHVAPSEKLNVAGVGVGGMGKSNLEMLAGENIVALCDVDDEYAAKTYEQYPKAKKYRDYRKMLEKQKHIDAVVIATPDHTHAVIAMAAIKMGKHVYCQKPITRTVYEARKLTEAAREHKVVTQMGNQGHSGEGIRLIKEWIADGAIGAVREVHTWTNRPAGWWPQGVGRPEEVQEVPETLDWDLWLGPAPYRPYNKIYLPFSWRGRWDFGTGALGDMGCHIIDPAFWALELGYPSSVEACSTNAICSDEVKAESAPLASRVIYQFPSRGSMPAAKLIWWDGGFMPPRPEELEEGRQMGGDNGGNIFIGDKGKIMSTHNGDSPRIIPEAKMKEYKRPKETIPRIEGGADGHEQDWARACKEGGSPNSNFDYAGPLTETVLLGNIAIRCGEKLYWDGAKMEATNSAAANEYVHSQYREGWSL
jgi:predicted dehydrogenase